MNPETEKLFNVTMQELISILEEFSPNDLNAVPFTGNWTAAQVGDHLYRSYGVVRTLKGNVGPTERPADEKISEVKELFLDFNIKMDSPEGIRPSIGFIDKRQLIDGISKRTAQFQDIIDNEDLSLTCYDYAIPEYGPFTRLEWIYFTIYHTRRHLHQINKIKEQVFI